MISACGDKAVVAAERVAAGLIGSSDIVVRTVAIDGVPQELCSRLAGVLDAEEGTRAARFMFDRHRRQFQVAHALKRLMLSAAAGGAVVPDQWAFETGPYGKPHIVQPGNLWFNLSHCDGLVACAISRQVEVGIDVEDMSRRAPLELADRYFAASEGFWLRGLAAAEQQTAFFRLWTLTEAYIKATGLGLSQRLDSFAFSFDPLGVTFNDPHLGHAVAWRFRQSRIGARHMLALAWRTATTEASMDVATVRLEALLDSADAQVPAKGTLSLPKCHLF